MPIRQRLEEIEFEIEKAAKKAGRKREDVILLGATKTVEPCRIQEAIDAGLRYIGENRVQELVDKYESVQGASWHFIGHLQTNKVKYIIDKAELIHAVDSAHLLREIQKQAQKRNRVAHVLLEINASGEESKFGMEFAEALPVILENEAHENVQIDGLMTIGPNTGEIKAVRASFEKMRHLFEELETQKFKNCK